jgi:hypothetical protein
MTEGTKSYLVGCHQFLMHPLQDIRGWRYEHNRWPRWWELVAIFCHDIGICGRQYLSVENGKAGHWKRGALLAQRLVSDSLRIKAFILGKHRKAITRTIIRAYAREAYKLCAGHCPAESGYPESSLFRPDKRSWLLAPMWWLWLNYYVEWHDKGVGVTPPPEWRKLVAENLAREKPMGSHELYLKHRRAAR